MFKFQFDWYITVEKMEETSTNYHGTRLTKCFFLISWSIVLENHGSWFLDNDITIQKKRARRDPGLVWSRATLTIENIREGSSVIRQFVALRPTLLRIVYIRRLSKGFGKSVSRQFAVVVIMLPSYPLDLGKVGYISTVDVEQRNFIPK